MNNKIYKTLSNHINDYESQINSSFNGNTALFSIFDNFFQNLKQSDELSENSGLTYENCLIQNFPEDNFNIVTDSFDRDGVSISFIFDNQKYFVKFCKYRDGDHMFYSIMVKSENEVKYSGNFIFKYLLYNALTVSNLKGSYFTMSRNRFEWDIKTLENRTFDDIFLPNDITEDLKLYVDIFKKSGRILRYLKVGSPGVGKTESTIVIASELKKVGVTIIKTPICEYLHDKIELANVLAPSLIIFDDIDLSLGDRNKMAYSMLLGDFLDVLDGTDKLSNDVGVIATTNAAHLLDLAAQRPGRFDKTLLFDNLTKDNIKNIINKSLRVNFNVTDKETINLYTDKKIINAFYDAGVTGSHIFNSIKMLKLRYDTLNVEDVDSEKIINGITTELDVISKIRKISHIKEKMDRHTAVGFNSYHDEDDEVKKIMLD